MRTTKWQIPDSGKCEELLAEARRIEAEAAERIATDRRDTLEEMTGRAPWVTAVVAVWGEFEQTTVDGDRVTFLHGPLLADWLAGQPTRLTQERTDELAVAVTALSRSPAAPSPPARSSRR